MKIMTYNVQHCKNYIEQRIDYDLIAKIIRESDAEIVALNEMYTDGEASRYPNQSAILSELSGYENYYFAEATKIRGESPYGNAMLSKLPFESVETIVIPDPTERVNKQSRSYETRCILKARFENGLTVLAIHIGLNPDEKENAIKTLLENITDKKCIVMGDFNIEPGDPLLTPIRERMQDSADKFSAPKLSFPSDKPTVKIDYIFASKDIEIVSADIPDIVGADHRPHIAEIKF